MVIKGREWYYIVSMYKYYQLALFLVLIGKFNQKSNFYPRLAGTKTYKSQVGPKRGENVVLRAGSDIT